MSKVAEKKALEAYPIESHEFYDCDYKERNAYVEGYDKAMQDFLEKAEKILTERMYFSDNEAKEFKNYMQDEEM